MGARGRTEKPGDVAQTALPAASQIMALSMLPGPRRLRGNGGQSRYHVDVGLGCTSDRCMLAMGLA